MDLIQPAGVFAAVKDLLGRRSVGPLSVEKLVVA